MSWLLLLLAAAGAVFFLLRAGRESRGRFREILEREAREERRSAPARGPAKDRDLDKDV